MSGGPASGRRLDLDWLRVTARGLLILTHVTYVYRTTAWRVQSEHAGLWGDLLVEALSPWRMSLVFFIGGAATRFMLQNRDLGGFTVNRILRLGVPFAMAALLLVPPMWYMTDPLARGQDYLVYVMHTPMHAHTVYGYHLPDLGHVWFLPYLFCYAMTAALAWRFAPRAWKHAEALFAAAPVVILVAAMAVLFVVSDALLKPVFGRSDMLIDDPAGHVRAIPAFLAGLMLARADAVWTKLRKARVWLAPAALAAMAAALAATAIETASSQTLSPAVVGTVDGIYGALAVFAILAIAQDLLNRDSPALRYLSDAIMPVYLMHQPVIIAAGLGLFALGAPVWVEYPLLLACTALIPLTIYHLVIRGSDPLRLAFGLRPRRRAAATNSAPQPSA